jgi:hypothetical protein
MPIIFLTLQSRTIGADSKAPTLSAPITATPLLNEYLAGLDAMHAGRKRAALTRLHRFNGEEVKRHIYAEKLARHPALHIDPEKQRVYPDGPGGSFFVFADLTKSLVDYLEWLCAAIRSAGQGGG